jgi:hypothetical protein
MSARNAKSIALTPQWARWVDDLVASGEYQSAVLVKPWRLARASPPHACAPPTDVAG